MSNRQVSFSLFLHFALGVSLAVHAATLTWDANVSSSNAQDGAGSWDSIGTNWWNGAANTNWSSANPDSATFGNGAAGGVVTLAEPVTVSNITFANSGYVISGTNTLTILGPRTITANQPATIDAIIAGGGFTKNGNGNLTLGGVNTFTGNVTVSTATLVITNANALGLSPLITVGNGQRLQLSGNIAMTNTATTVSINGTGTGDSIGALISSANSTNTWAGSVVLAGDQTRIGAATNATLIVSGPITSPGTNIFGAALRNIDGVSGLIILSGASTYSGNTYIVVGKVQLAGGDNRLPVKSALVIGNTGNNGMADVLDLNGYNQQLAGLSDLANGAKMVTNSAGALSTLTISSATTYSYGANGATIAGPIALVKGGTGTQVLRGVVNTYSGGTTINNGTLALGADTNSSENTKGLGTGPVAINGGATLRLGGSAINIGATTAPPAVVTYNITNAVTMNGGTIWAVEGIQHFSNNTFTVGTGGGSLITVNGDKDLWIDHTMSGSGPLTVDNAATTTGGTATVRFTGAASTYNGTITVNGPSAGYLGGRIAIYGNTPLANATLVMNGTNSLGFGSSAPVLGALAGSGDIAIPAGNTLSVGNNGSNTTYAGVLGGSGTFMKLGAGIQTLAANSTITGTINVTGGTLALAASGSLSNSAVVTGSAGTFDVTAISPFVIPVGEPLMGNGTVSGTVLAVDSARVVPGGDGAAGTLTIVGSLAMNANGTNTFDLSTPGAIGGGVNDLLVVNGGLEPSGSVIRINALTALSNGTYRLVNYTGAKTTAFNPAPVGNLTHKTWTIDEATSGQVNFVISGTYGNLRWNPVTSTNWNLSETNWFDVVTLLTNNFLNLDSVLFDDNGAFSSGVNLAMNVQPGSVVVNSASNYSITGSGKISGATGITKSGPGTLVLGGTANDYSGPVTISNGILLVATASALGSTSTATIVRGGTLDINGFSLNTADDLVIFGNGLNNTGAVINSGASQDRAVRSITLGSDATIAAWGNRWDVRGTSVVDLANFTLTKQGGGQVFIVEMTMTNAGNINVASGTLSIARGVTSGEGVIGVSTGAMISLENYSSGLFNKSIALTNGTLRQVADAVVLSSRVSIAGSSVIEVQGAMGFLSPITGPGSLRKTGTGPLVFKTTNSYSGSTTLASGGGTLILNAATGPSVLGPVQIGTASDGGGVTLLVCSNNQQFAAGVSIGFGGSPVDWAQLKLCGTSQSVDSVASDDNAGGDIENALTDNGVGDGILVISGSGNSLFSGSIMRDSVSPSTSTGKLRLFQNGSGTLTLAGAGTNMTFTGGVTVNSGTLNLKALNCAGVGTITMAGGLLSLDGAGMQEGVVFTNAIDLVSVNPLNRGVKLSTKRANLSSDLTNNTQWIYSGYLVVTNPSGTTYTFGENFDDIVVLRIDGTSVLNDLTGYAVPTIGTISLSPGLHRFDLRVLNTASGGGPVNSQWWTNTTIGVGYDPLGRGQTNMANYQAVADAGDGLFLCTEVTITNAIALQADTKIKVSNAIGPTNTIAGAIDDSGAGRSVTKTGAGILRLAGMNTYGGATTVSNGTLLIDGYNLGTGAVTVQTNASLWGTGTVLMASVTVDAGGQIGPRPGSAGGGTFTVTNLTLSAGSTFNALVNGAVPTIHALGDLVVSPSISVKVTSLAPMTVGTNVLLDYDGTFTGSIGDFSLGVLANGAQGYLENNIANSSIDLVITNSGLGIKWDGIVNGIWDVAGTANWKSILSGASAPFSMLDSVSFDDTASSNFAITLAQSVTVASFAISNETRNYSFSGGSIGGNFGITKNGAAKLSLLNANTFTGATVVSAGTLAITSDSSLGLAPAAATTQLTLNAGTTLEALTNLTINANRRVAIGPSGSAGSATLLIPTSSTFTVSSVIADAGGATGTLIIAGSGTLIPTTFNRYSGGTFVDGATLQINIAGSATPANNAIPANRPLTLRNGATLRLGGNTSLGQGPGNPNIVTVNLSRVTAAAVNNHQDIPDMVLIGGYISSEGTSDQFGQYICDGSIRTLASTATSVIDTATFDLRGAYTASPYLVTFTVEDGAAEHDLLVTSQLMDFPGYTSKLIKSGAGTMTIATAPSTNIYSGWTLINNGTLMLGTNNVIAMPRGPITNNARLVLNLAGGIISNRIDGTGVMANAGSGVVTLLANNTCSGGTQISNGTLIVNGALGAGAVTVAASATLGGTGTVNGAVTSDGIVAPGISAGLLTLAQNYTQNSSGSLNIEIGGSGVNPPGVDYDELIVGGSVNLGGELKISLINGYVPTLSDTYVILQAGVSISGEFASTNLPALTGGNQWVVQKYDNFILLTLTNVAPSSGYDVFATQISNPALRGMQNDADDDGYANLLEYVTGGNPTNADAQARMDAVRTNGVLALQFTRDTNTVDATLIVEGSYASTNSALWSDIAVNSNGTWTGAATVTEAGTTNPVNVTVQDTAVAATNRFLRLRVTHP